MNIIRKITKHRLCIQHRQAQYDKALDKLIDGQATPEYVHERWIKLQEAKKGKANRPTK